MKKNIIFSLLTFGIGISTIILLYRFGLNSISDSNKQLSIKTIMDYISSYDGFANFEVVIRQLRDILLKCGSYIDSFVNDGFQWTDILLFLESILVFPMGALISFIAFFVNLFKFIIDSIVWIIGLLTLIN